MSYLIGLITKPQSEWTLVDSFAFTVFIGIIYLIVVWIINHSKRGG